MQNYVFLKNWNILWKELYFFINRIFFNKSDRNAHSKFHKLQIRHNLLLFFNIYQERKDGKQDYIAMQVKKEKKNYGFEWVLDKSVCCQFAIKSFLKTREIDK